MDSQHGGSDGVRGYLRVLARRKWVIILTLLLVTSAAVYLSLRQQPLYSASADVLIKHQNLAAGLTGVQDFSTVYEDAARIGETQARLAHTPTVATRVVDAAGITGTTADEVLASSTVTSDPSSDLLHFEVIWNDPDAAKQLATAYAAEFVRYRQELDTTSLTAARKELEDRIEQLREDGFKRTKLYEGLIETEQQLRTMVALQSSNASISQPATEATQVQPQPIRNGILGFALGLLLGIGLAFLREALDTRVRSASEVGNVLGLPLLVRLPEPPRRLRDKNRLVMLEDPRGVQAEAFRMLRTNLEFANLERGAELIVITSALEREGKSTTVANLGVALARSGRRVVVVDLDLRRPMLARFFGLEDHSGLTDVALGHVTLDAARARVALGESREQRFGNGAGRIDGVLEVLTAGPTPPDPGEFSSSHVLGEILARLRDEADVVLIDTPPLLHVGDAMALSAHVDALIVVTRLSLVRRPTITELKRVLEAAPVSKLGFVLTGAELEEGYGYADYTYAYRYSGYVPSDRERVT